jgi:hypothetical protein
MKGSASGKREAGNSWKEESPKNMPFNLLTNRRQNYVGLISSLLDATG